MKQISINQCGVLIVMCIFANKILLLPSLMYEKTSADSIFVLITLFLLDFIMLPILIKLKNLYPEQKFYDILKDKLGSLVTKIIYITLLIFFFFKCLLVFSITYVYFKQQIYQDEFIFMALISFFPVINHAVFCGLRSFSRTMELFFGIVIAGFIFCLVISLFTPISSPLFFTSTAKEFFTSMHNHIFAFGDFIFLFLAMDRLDFKKGKVKSLYFYTLFAMFLVVLLFFLFYAKYQMTAFMHNNALADLLVFSVQFNAIGRLDIIAMLTIMIITLFQMEIFSYAFCDCFMSIFPLNKIYSVAVFDVLFLILYYVFIGIYEIMVKSSLLWLPYLSIFINYILPIITLIIIIIDIRQHGNRPVKIKSHLKEKNIKEKV